MMSFKSTRGDGNFRDWKMNAELENKTYSLRLAWALPFAVIHTDHFLNDVIRAL
jgi:hypothetical protein